MSWTPRRGLTPLPIAVLAAAGAALVALPLAGLALRTPWSKAWAAVASPVALTALRLSLVVATSASVIAFVVGLPLAWVLARSRVPGRTILRGIVVLPLVMPPVVGGVALLTAFGRRGLVGAPLYRLLGVQITFTTGAAILAATFVSFPLMVLALEAGLRAMDLRLEQAAVTLGASRWYVLRRVTLPLLAPQIVAGFVLSWARALGEFGATITFAGNLRGVTQTLPLAVFQELQTDPGGAVALSLSLVAISLAVIVGLRARFLSAP
ncbi:MAG TPA: ABC transporter permease [Actinomycetota bacterium]|jgi:molybdate transport system permease protein|nr:ABC transporter permease [Actinomycetota bacterium]